jgi:hypothetical protein
MNTRKTETYVCLLQTETEKGRMMNGNRQLVYQQTCPSMLLVHFLILLVVGKIK